MTTSIRNNCATRQDSTHRRTDKEIAIHDHSPLEGGGASNNFFINDMNHAEFIRTEQNDKSHIYIIYLYPTIKWYNPACSNAAGDAGKILPNVEECSLG